MSYQTIQLWPSGKSVRYAGEYPYYVDSEGVTFYPEMQEEIETELRAERYVSSEILCCQSALVDDLLRNGEIEGFSHEDYAATQCCDEWDFASLKSYADDHDLDVNAPTLQEFLDGLPTADQIAERLMQEEPGFTSVAIGVSGENPGQWELVVDDITDFAIEADVGLEDGDSIDLGEIVISLRDQVKASYDEEEYIDDLREAVQDHMDCNPVEVYEWWLVTSWLGEQLKDAGEPVLDNDYGTWWGRTCTGQSMIMDGTLQNIARRFAKYFA